MKFRACSFSGFTIVLFLLVLSTPIGAAQSEIELGTLLSRYLWRGIRLSDGAVYQSSFTYGYKGASLNLWGNCDFKTSKLNEIDFTLSYTRDVGKIGIESGIIHYGIFSGRDTDEIFAGISSGGPIQPSLKVYFDVDEGRGAYVQVAGEHTYELSPHVAFDLRGNMSIVIQNGYMGRTDAGREFTGLYSGELSAALPIKFNDHWKLSPKAGVTAPLSRNGRQAIVNGSVWQSENPSFKGVTFYGGATLIYSF